MLNRKTKALKQIKIYLKQFITKCIYLIFESWGTFFMGDIPKQLNDYTKR